MAGKDVYSYYSGMAPSRAGQAEATTDLSGWQKLVIELMTMQKQGLQPTAPENLARIFAECSGNELQAALHHFPAPRDSIRIDFEVQAPMWRLTAVYPANAGEGVIRCTLRATLPLTFASLSSGQGISIEIFATGEMGRLASTVVSRAAHAKLAELRRAGQSSIAQCVMGIIEWVENAEVLELAASMCAPAPPPGNACSCIRAFVRFHHCLGLMKRGYMRLWADDLGLGALLAVGQPAMLLAEGPADAVCAFVDRVTKLIHWGPTPARLVGSTAVGDDDGSRLPSGLREVLDVYAGCVSPNGTYNGRHSTNYIALAAALGKAGHTAAAQELRDLAASAFAHVDGRVAEAADGTGWVGYSAPECQLARPQSESRVPEPRRRYKAGQKGPAKQPQLPAPAPAQRGTVLEESGTGIRPVTSAGPESAPLEPEGPQNGSREEAPKRRWGRRNPSLAVQSVAT